MAILDNRLSSTNLPAPLLAPKSYDITNESTDFERGGIAIEDITQGMDYQDWQVTIEGQNIVVTPLSEGNPVIAFVAAGTVTEVSLAFDQLMHIFIAFVEDGIAQFYWYDPISELNEFFILPVNSINPCCTFDDHRYTQVPSSDIIVAYIIANELFFRMQSNRYTVEYPLATGLAKLHRIGMGTNNRLQFAHIPT